MVRDIESGSDINPGIESGVETEKTAQSFGKNVKLEVEFTRHEEPGKTPEGMSADFLTEKGKQRAAAKGPEITTDVKAYASPKLRAQETVDLALQNVDADVRVINQKLNADLQGKLIGQKEGNNFNIRIRPELDVVKNFAAIMPEAKAAAQQQIANGSKQSEYSLIIQYYLDNPQRAQELGVTTPEQAAEETAVIAEREIDMAKRLYDDSDVKLLNGTHAPKLEPFLQKIMIRNGNTGFQSLEEIGGALNPGEGFKFKVETDASGNSQVKMLLRGQQYDIDLEQVRKLAEAYRTR